MTWPSRSERERFRDVRILEEPLLAQARLDGHVGAFAEADVVFVGLFLIEQAALLEHFGGALARVEAVEAVQLGGVVLAGIVDLAVGREDVDERAGCGACRFRSRSCRARA